MRISTLFALLFVLATATVAVSAAANVSTIKVNPDTSYFVDETGRTRFFRGVNSVYKIPPYHPVTDRFDPQLSMCSKDLDDLKEWGFNVVRLGIQWQGVMPNNATVNETYLQTMAELVDQMAQRNIYVILDCHQDLLSPFFCGEGVPDFVAHMLLPNGTAAFPFPAVFKDIPKDPNTGYPEIKVCLELVKSFARYYFSEAVGESFNSLFHNRNGAAKVFEAYWQAVARVFKNRPNVLGYEIINEPWPGNVIKNPGLLLPAEMERDLLQPFYAEVAKAIRQVDNDKIIFYEPAVNSLAKTGMTEGPGGAAYNDRQALSYHIYCGDTNQANDPRNQVICDFQEDIGLQDRAQDVKRLGGGGIITEFGANWNDTAGVEGMDFVMDEAQRYFQSYIYWQFKSFHDITTASTGDYEGFYGSNGDLQTAKVRALTRSYPVSLPGTPNNFVYQWNTGEIILEYTIDSAAEGDAEIYVNEQYHYPNGYDVTILPNESASWSHQHNTIFIHHVAVQHGDVITVHVKAK